MLFRLIFIKFIDRKYRKFGIKIFLFIMAIIRNMFMSGFQYCISTKLVYKLGCYCQNFMKCLLLKLKFIFCVFFSLTWPFVSIKYMAWVMQWDRNCYNIPMLKFHHARHTISSFFFKSPTCTMYIYHEYRTYNLKNVVPSCNNKTWGKPCSCTMRTPSTDFLIPIFSKSSLILANLAGTELSFS